MIAMYWLAIAEGWEKARAFLVSARESRSVESKLRNIEYRLQDGDINTHERM